MQRGALNLNQLRTFAAVARWGSFSRAAEHLYITQPAVSAQMRALEQHFGTELVEVLGRKTYVTPAGELLLSYAQRIFSLASEAEDAIHEVRGLQRGRLRVGGSPTLGVYLLPAVLGSFAARYPGIELHLDIGSTAQIAELVKANELTLGAVEAEVHDPSLLVTEFLEDELVLIVPPAHRWAIAGVATIDELKQQPFLLREVGSGARTLIDTRLADLGIRIKVAMELGNNEAIKRAVMAGLGVSLISKYAIRSELALGQLKQACVPGLSLRHSFSWIIHRDKRLSAAASAFLNCLRETLAEESTGLSGQ